MCVKKLIERAKDGILQLRPDGIVWPPCKPGTVYQGVLKFENVGAVQRGQKLDARYPESIEDGVLKSVLYLNNTVEGVQQVR